MKETDRKQKFKGEWYEKPTLTPAEVQRLFQEKIERARQYHQALKQQEKIFEHLR